MDSQGVRSMIQMPDPLHRVENIRFLIQLWFEVDNCDMLDQDSWEQVAERMSTVKGITKSIDELEKFWAEKVDPNLNFHCGTHVNSRQQYGWIQNVMTEDDAKRNVSILSRRLVDVRSQMQTLYGTVNLQISPVTSFKLPVTFYAPVEFETEMPRSPSSKPGEASRPVLILENRSFHILHCKKDVPDCLQATMTDYTIKLYGGTVITDINDCNENTLYIASTCETFNRRMYPHVRGVLLRPETVCEWIKAVENLQQFKLDTFVKSFGNLNPSFLNECVHYGLTGSRGSTFGATLASFLRNC